MTGRNSTCVKPIDRTYSERGSAISRYASMRPPGPRRQEPRWTSYTEIGELEFWSEPRDPIQSASPHEKSRSQTTDAVFGGVSCRKPNGSALSTRYPRCRETMWNL